MSHEETLWMYQLKALGLKQGYLTFAQINEYLPGSVTDPEISNIVEQLKRAGIRVVDRDPPSDAAVTVTSPKSPRPSPLKAELSPDEIE